MQAVVLSGGAGSRLWPVSSNTCPKPFITTADGLSLIQKVYLRASNISSVDSIITVANRDFVSQIKDEYSKIDSLAKRPVRSHFILEPFAKNTAAAIAASALQVSKLYGLDEMMLILPADHLVSDQKAFEEAVVQAQYLAKGGKLVTFGIKPEYPETGYGYIEFSGNKVERFVEKPTQDLAQAYIEKGNFLWNSGIFCFTARSILQEMQKHCLHILDNVQRSMGLSILAKNADSSQIELDSLAFSSVSEESIDYALMEKSDQIAVVPCDIGWRDIGTWEALSKLSPADADGNRVKGNATLHNVSDCYIESNGQLVGVVGVKNLAIISTKNGFLVTDKQNSEKVRNIYAQLQDNENKIRNFSWGRIRSVQGNNGLRINQVEVNPGAEFNIASNLRYAANWIVVSGVAEFSSEEQKTNMAVNESKYIPLGSTMHLTNTGNSTLVIITIQLDDYLSKNGMIMPEDVFDKVSNG